MIQISIIAIPLGPRQLRARGWGITMATYRSYCLDGARVIESAEYEGDDDAEALELFALRGEKSDCELWCGDRKVATIAKGTEPILAISGSTTNPTKCS